MILNRMIESRIAPILRDVTAMEASVLSGRSNPNDSTPIAQTLRGRRKIDEGILRVASASCWILLGAGLIALSNGMILLRAYDLVVSKNPKISLEPSKNPSAKQAAAIDGDKVPRQIGD